MCGTGTRRCTRTHLQRYPTPACNLLQWRTQGNVEPYYHTQRTKEKQVVYEGTTKGKPNSANGTKTYARLSLRLSKLSFLVITPCLLLRKVLFSYKLCQRARCTRSERTHRTWQREPCECLQVRTSRRRQTRSKHAEEQHLSTSVSSFISVKHDELTSLRTDSTTGIEGLHFVPFDANRMRKFGSRLARKPTNGAQPFTFKEGTQSFISRVLTTERRR